MLNNVDNLQSHIDESVILAIDMDGVIADWYVGFTRRWEALGYKALPAEELKHFYIEDSYPVEHRGLVKSVALAQGFYESLPPVEGAIEALKSMEADPLVEPYLCTAPELDFEGHLCWTEKARWVEKHLGPYWLKRLMIIKDKSLAYADYLIDDKPNMKGLMIHENKEGTHSHSWTRIVYDRPYNKETAGVRMTWVDWPKIREQMHQGFIGL